MILDLDKLQQNGDSFQIKLNGQIINAHGFCSNLCVSTPACTDISYHGFQIARPSPYQELSLQFRLDQFEYLPPEQNNDEKIKISLKKFADPKLGSTDAANAYFNESYEERAERDVNAILDSL